MAQRSQTTAAPLPVGLLRPAELTTGERDGTEVRAHAAFGARISQRPVPRAWPGHPVTPGGATTRPSHVVWALAVIASGLLLVLFYQRLQRQAAERDALAGMLARFGDLAVTGTELLVGSTRYPLAGMRAWVQDDPNGITYLHVEGPTVALVRKVAKRRSAEGRFAMRQWAHTLNLNARDNPQQGMSA
jgi:hypothetical protein